MPGKGKKKIKKGSARRIKLYPGGQVCLMLFFSLILVVSLMLSRCGTLPSTLSSPPPAERGEKAAVATAALEIPRVIDDTFLKYNAEGRYYIYYDTTYRQAALIAYTLTRSDVETKGAERSDSFHVDKYIKEQGWRYSSTADYTNSGYDKGHLLPSADRDGSPLENSSTFLLSNISPQTPELNRGVWKLLEDEVRDMALRFDTLYIVTGPLLKGDLKRIGKNGVGIPEYFFKAILTRRDDKYISIGFLIPNAKRFDGGFLHYSTTVNRIEDLCGFDFFYNLPDEVEEDVERGNDPQNWK